MLGKRLVASGYPVLAIKADLLDTDVSNEADLREHLGLSDRPSTMLTRLAAFGPVFLLIDQLDALAGYLDLRTGRLSTLLNLVRCLGRIARSTADRARFHRQSRGTCARRAGVSPRRSPALLSRKYRGS